MLRLTKREVRQISADPVEGPRLVRFFRRLSEYQQDSGSSKAALREAYRRLPPRVAEALAVTPRVHSTLYRGDDGQSTDPATSWTTSRSLARFFGHYVFSARDLQGYNGSVSTAKAYALADNLPSLEAYPLGDDEGEVILFDVTWKPMTRLQMEASRRAD